MHILTMSIAGVIFYAPMPFADETLCEDAWRQMSPAFEQTIPAGQTVTPGNPLHLCILEETACGRGTKVKCKGRAAE